MKADNTIEQHPSWLKEGQTLRCLTPEDRAVHKAMSEVIYEVIKEFTRAGKRRNLLLLNLTKEYLHIPRNTYIKISFRQVVVNLINQENQ